MHSITVLEHLHATYLDLFKPVFEGVGYNSRAVKAVNNCLRMVNKAAQKHRHRLGKSMIVVIEYKTYSFSGLNIYHIAKTIDFKNVSSNVLGG